MFTVRNMLPLLLVVLLSCGLSFGATKIVPTEYSTIQAALTAADPCDVIEVQSNATFTENLVFKADVNNLILRAGTGNTPTICVTGVTGTVDTNYIEIRSVGTIIQGFKITTTGTFSDTNNGNIILAKGGASAVRDCDITGPTATQANAVVRGIAGIAEVNNVVVSYCRIGVLCDANWFNTGFNYSVTDSWIHDNRYNALVFNDCNAVVDNCLIERSGTALVETSNVATQGSGTLLNLLIKNSTIRTMVGVGRNFRLASKGTVTLENCMTRDARFDEILVYQGNLNLNRCILKNTDVTGGCVAVVKQEGTSQPGAIVDINHCSLYGYAGAGMSYQWAVWTGDPDASVTVRNSILTGHQGYHVAGGTAGFFTVNGGFTSNYNDNDCNSPISGPAASAGVVPGPQDLRQTGGPRFDPYYIQTSSDCVDCGDPNITTYFALQPYSPVIGKDAVGGNMGAKGVVYGHEKWPADLDGVYGVDNNDLKVLASNWLNSTHILPAGPNKPLEEFESYTTIPDTNCYVLNWTYGDPCFPSVGSSTLSLLNPGDYNNSKALRWVFDVNKTTGGGQFTEILVILPQTIDINVFPGANGLPSSPYNQLKVRVNRHAGNSPETETFMYAKFLDKTIYPSTATHQKLDIAYQVIGGSTDANEGEWVPWTINLNNLSLFPGTSGTRASLTRISAILFGISAQPNGPWGVGQGTIDADKLELIDLAGCTSPVLGDINNDCFVNFRDFAIFGNYWMDGK